MFFYLSKEEILNTYLKTIEVSGGGSAGYNGKEGENQLDSILGHIQNDIYYPEIEDKLLYLFYGINKGHIFSDGNKRMAIVACGQFLFKNGYLYAMKKFMIEMENISYHVASSKINKNLLKEIIISVIYEDEFSEDLKLEIYNAISK